MVSSRVYVIGHASCKGNLPSCSEKRRAMLVIHLAGFGPWEMTTNGEGRVASLREWIMPSDLRPSERHCSQGEDLTVVAVKLGTVF